ncbi:MAG: sulfite exporter TauE/SafE family protein [Nitrospirota bacterium]|nr:sulfite exporter TauE/SafE family protein [Nitrospirota bacterium]
MTDAGTLILLCLGAGAFAGFIGALFGVGGGLVIVPTLTVVFTLLAVPEEVRVHLAVGTSLAIIVFVSLAAVRAHHRLGKVPWPRVREFAPSVAFGALLGAVLASRLPGPALKACVGGFALLMAAQMTLVTAPRATADAAPLPLSRTIGGLIGAVSAIVGIGGGSLTVPYLLHRHTPIHGAVPVSSACGFPIALFGALGFAAMGASTPDLPPFSAGYVSFPALAAIGLTSVLFAPLGARVAHRLPARALRRLFILLLIVVGLFMVFG